MAFNSLGFALFLTAVFLLHWLLPERLRGFLLLAASLVFYLSWGAGFLPSLLCAALLSWAAGLVIGRTAEEQKRKRLLCLAVCLSLAPLFVFKYFNFFAGTLFSGLRLLSLPVRPVTLKLLQPVGISFYTFQTIGYEIDVYRRKVPAERSFGTYLLFVAFFPQIVSGPIGRADALLPQLKQARSFDYDRASRGLRLLVWGCFKKMVIADHLAVFVDAVYGDPAGCGGMALLLAIALFSLEIYCDFSGYSDIAVGCGKLLGVELAENFKSPYFAGSVREFWGRWHISLSTWFRDYLYIPLGGNRVSKARNSLNLMITFLASGLWHGADWTFLVWGGLHGLARVGEARLAPGRRDPARGGRVFRVAGLFVFTSLAWVFFRADTLQDAVYVIGHALSGITAPGAYLAGGLAFLREHLLISKKILALSLLLLAACDLMSLRTDVFSWLSGRPAWQRCGLYLLVGMLTLLCHCHGNVSFIYFQF